MFQEILKNVKKVLDRCENLW